jgi:hypothetical protein
MEGGWLATVGAPALFICPTTLRAGSLSRSHLSGQRAANSGEGSRRYAQNRRDSSGCRRDAVSQEDLALIARLQRWNPLLSRSDLQVSRRK